VHDGRNGSRRDDAYRQAHEALAGAAYQRAMEQAETFLSAPPFVAADPREPGIRDLYAEALVRWFSTGPQTLDEASAARLRRYASLNQGKEPAP
jgi:hypothetical protein